MRVARFAVSLLAEIPEAARAALEAVWFSFRRLRCRILLRGHWGRGAVVLIERVFRSLVVLCRPFTIGT